VLFCFSQEARGVGASATDAGYVCFYGIRQAPTFNRWLGCVANAWDSNKADLYGTTATSACETTSNYLKAWQSEAKSGHNRALYVVPPNSGCGAVMRQLQGDVILVLCYELPTGVLKHVLSRGKQQ